MGRDLIVIIHLIATAILFALVWGVLAVLPWIRRRPAAQRLSWSIVTATVLAVIGLDMLGSDITNKFDEVQTTLTETGQALQAEVDALSEGAIAADIPAEMTQGEGVEVTVEIARAATGQVNQAIDTLNRKYQRPVAEAVTTGARMYVDLAAPDGSFTAERVAPAARYQYVPLDRSAVWVFRVTPQAAGAHELIVTAGIDAKVDGDETALAYGTYRKTVAVRVNPAWWLHLYWAAYAEPLVTAIIGAVVTGIGAVITYFVARWWKRRPKKPQPKSAKKKK